MPGENKPALVAVRHRRDEIIAWLSEAFAGDALDVDEFEDRVSLAHRADSIAALEVLVQDLAPLVPEPPVTALATRSDASVATARPAERRVTSIMGGFQRRGAWTVPAKLRVINVMGGGELDFRDVSLPPGETEVKIATVMGGVTIIVPPDIAVECEGTGIMGAFENLDRATAVVDPEQPRLRIHGWCLMGAVEITTRQKGESGREARKRKRRERRSLSAARRRQLKD